MWASIDFGITSMEHTIVINKVYTGATGLLVDFVIDLTPQEIEDIKKLPYWEDLQARGVYDLTKGKHYLKMYPYRMFVQKFPSLAPKLKDYHVTS